MKVDVYDNKGKSVAKLTLDKSVFGVEPNKVLLAQYLRVFQTIQNFNSFSSLLGR